MARERRVFNLYPVEQRTPQNDRETAAVDDVVYEPEQASFINGFIGDVSVLTPEDLARVPQLQEGTPERTKYQLSIATNFINPDTQERESGAFFSDLINQIEANGGFVEDQNRIFSTNFYAWTPPVDYDKHINYSRYRWTGVGTADVNGEYVTKEPSHSKTAVYEFNGTIFVKKNVTVVNGLPAVGASGTYVEDASTADRYVYRSNGAVWNLIDFDLVDDVPTDTTGYLSGDVVYVARTGPEFNRPLVWKYSEDAGRWLPLPVVVSPVAPENTRINMVWEDSRVPPRRRLKIFENGTFVDLAYTPQDGPSGIGTDGEYIYDTRDYADLTDPWKSANWWRHFEDLCPADRAVLTPQDQAIRPMLEFWGNIESVAGDTKDSRNDAPVYMKYAYDGADIVDTTEGTTIFQFAPGTGEDDFVLGFPLAFSDTGEILFQLTLESDPSAFVGYKYFRDTVTGYVHSVWSKSSAQTEQGVDANGLFDQPVNLTSNADHGILLEAARGRMLGHMTSVISSQEDFQGDLLGQNSYRWTDKNPAVGATIIDPEQSVLRALGLLQRGDLDMPNAIRLMAKEYNKVLFRFTNKLNMLWDNETISNGGTDTLIVTPSEAVDAILTELFFTKNEDFPFYYSNMGTYIETRVEAGIAVPIDPSNPKPIFVPPSAARVGAAPTFDPNSFVDRDGTTLLRGHDGSIIDSFGDERDLVWLELQQRFFEAVPEEYRTETDTFSSRFSNFVLEDFYGNYVPLSATDPVDDVVDDFNTEPPPASGTLWFSKMQGVFAVFNGDTFLTRPAVTDDIFLNNANGEYYIFNGLSVFEIDRWNRPFDFDYTDNEYRQIIRRDFERFVLNVEQDFTANTTFNEADKFTWNYRSAGVEGYYRGIYRRVYNTEYPHLAAWEIMGYKIEPTWWRTQYVPDSTAPDGTPRYGSAHPMWSDFATGVVDHPGGPIQKDEFVLAGPIPVDAVGELLDPIAAGVVDIEKLDLQRIDDFWIYGDGAPVEEEFLRSQISGFSISLAGFLMKNGVWVDTLWSEAYIEMGDTGTNTLFRAPHVIHRDTRTRPSIGVLPVHLQVINGVITQRLGVNAWVSEYVNINGGSPTNDFARILQNTSAALAWKTSGFINQARTVISTLSSEEIPFEDVHVILHESQPIETKFASGVIVVREEPGYRVFGYDAFNPFFTVERPAVPIIGGQVELRQDFTAVYTDTGEANVTGGSVFPNKEVQHLYEVTEFKLPKNKNDNDTAKIAVLVNGQRLKAQHFNILSGNTIEIESLVELEPGDVISASLVTTQSNPSTQTRQFFVDGVAFPYFAQGTGEYDQIEYGRFFSTSNEVINFLIGYGRYLNNEGWKFDDVTDGGEPKDWLYVARQFARFVLDVESPWNPDPETPIEQRDTFLSSPMSNIAKFESPFGMTLNVESIMNGAFGILNEKAEPIDPDETFVTRIDQTLTVERVNNTDPDSMIFGVRVNITETEHVVFFSNITRFNDLIYDPVTALTHETLRVDSYRTLNWEGRLEANGYIIDGGTLLPNFEKQAFDFTRFYDRYNTIDDPTKREQARNLYGYVPANQSRFRSQIESLEPRTSTDASQYMIPLSAADRTRFDYYRGMIQTKGTVRPIYAFARGTTIGRDAVIVNEDWAWKLQEFGDTRREIIQFRLDENQFRDEVQVVAFTDAESLTDNTIEILPFDRDNPNANPQWIRPPKYSKDMTCNVDFPVDSNGLPDVEDYEFYANLFDTETGFNVLGHVHYDPQVGKFDTDAQCQVDYTQLLDPARYNVGPGAAYSAELCWGYNQVNKLWWSTERREYVDYRSLIPDYEDMSAQWGRLKFFKANITRVAEVVTVETLDPFGSGAVVPHGVDIGDVIVVTIRGADQEEYDGVAIEVTATSSTEFQYEIDTQPETPATGKTEIVIGHIDIYQWVKSPVPPQDWEVYVENLNDPSLPNGVPLDVDNPSYVQLSEIVNGRTQPVYFFWVLNSTGTNPDKKYTPFQISNRLGMPTQLGVPWFAPVDKDHMLIFTDGEKVEQGYAFEVITDAREFQTHVEWILVSEGNRFLTVPQQIVDKIIDSLSQIDQFGNTVPSPSLSDTEKYGACFFPVQTVFRNIDDAISTYITALNTLFQSKNLSEVDNLTGIFKLSDELSDTNPTGFWQRTAFVEPSAVGETVFDTVASIAERDLKALNGYYAEGDLIKVLDSGNTDPWDGSDVAATYRLESGLFLTVGLDDNTVAVNENLTLDVNNFRLIYYETYDILDILEQNNLIFSMLNEMLVQSLTCDWFFKTSYITTQVFTQALASPFVRADETIAIRENILDVKPFRTKLRSETNTVAIPLEDVPVSITEFPDKKISLIFDRLSCNLLDDCTWGSSAWGTEELPCYPWGMPIWDFADVGRQQFYVVEEFVGNAITTVFNATPIFDPTLYPVQVVIYQNGVEIDQESNGISVVIVKSTMNIRVSINTPLPASYTIQVQQAQGFYEGTEPNFNGTTMEGSLFQPAPIDYKHFVARTLRTAPDSFDPRSVMIGCTNVNDPLGGRPEERIVAEPCDTGNIYVTNEFTEAYKGWGATPWGTTGWGTAMADVGDRVFILSVGKQLDIPVGLEMLPTSEDITVISVNPNYAISTNPKSYQIEQVELQKGGVGVFNIVTEGVEFEFIDDPVEVVLQGLQPVDQEFIADGATTSFQTTMNTTISYVFRNGLLQTAGVHYNLDPSETEITFIQPPNTIVEDFDTPFGTSHVGDGITTAFSTGTDPSIIQRRNVFAFINGDLQPFLSYDPDDAIGIEFNSVVPGVGDQILLYTLNNTLGDPDGKVIVFNIDEFTAAPAQTIFNLTSGGFGTEARTFVFVNGRYLHGNGVDYIVGPTDTVTLIAPLAGGESVDIRVLNSPVVDVEHVTFTTSGGATDNITGITDADSPSLYMLFLGDTIQDGYTTLGVPDFTISNGNPDVINWTVVPGAGIDVSFRYIRKARVRQTVIVNVLPLEDDVIVARFDPYFEPGDVVRLRYNGWSVGSQKNFNVVSTPANDYDISGTGILKFASLPPVNDFIILDYIETRKDGLPESILVRMEEIVADVLADHTAYTEPNGFNDYRPAGTRIIDTTLNQIFEWDGTVWNAVAGLPPGTQVFVTRTQEIWEFSAGVFSQIFEVGGTLTNPPVLGFPAFGRGITFGTYAYGTTIDAATEFPDAYQIMQHPGSSPP